MRIIAVAELPNGERVEGVLTIPDEFAASAGHGNALERSRVKLQTAVNVAAENMAIAKHDYEVERERRASQAKRSKADDVRGPDQVAFAGSFESVEVPNTGTVTHAEALRKAGLKETVDAKSGRKMVKRLGDAPETGRKRPSK